MSDFKLGPLQTQWIQSLRDYPERQMRSVLGDKKPDGSYQACCLGEAGIIAGVCRWDDYGSLVTNDGFSSSILAQDTYKAIGLRSPRGDAKAKTEVKSLAYYNDYGKTWPQIADILTEDPEMYFTEPK